MLADFRSYVECQQQVGRAYAEREYSEHIWRVQPVPIKLLSRDDVKGRFLQ